MEKGKMMMYDKTKQKREKKERERERTETHKSFVLLFEDPHTVERLEEWQEWHPPSESRIPHCVESASLPHLQLLVSKKVDVVKGKPILVKLGFG